ncbi:MAG TPA: ATP-binding cassette domain-containing protein [Candidatus Binataceae bacterium]|nr:ATP-binding cassette domain-containing protein [Candidatus Binataceae bacterium]
MLEARIVKRRRPFAVEVELRLERGGRLGLFGASGAGKSTVLSCIAGLEQPDEGEVRFGGQRLYPPNLPLHRRPLAYLTQNDLLFPHLTVGENVCFGLGNGDREAAQAWVGELSERLGLAALWNERAREVSGGQARRVALARMLARRPPLVLLDEPFGALDLPTLNDLADAILQWQRKLGFTMVAVDHRAEILGRLCEQGAVIESGHIIQQGAWPDLVRSPATELTARLLGA